MVITPKPPLLGNCLGYPDKTCRVIERPFSTKPRTMSEAFGAGMPVGKLRETKETSDGTTSIRPRGRRGLLRSAAPHLSGTAARETHSPSAQTIRIFSLGLENVTGSLGQAPNTAAFL